MPSLSSLALTVPLFAGEGAGRPRTWDAVDIRTWGGQLRKGRSKSSNGTTLLPHFTLT